jgi:hypothetical protein
MALGLFIFLSSTVAPFLLSFVLAPPKPRRKQYGALCLLSFIFSRFYLSETKKKIQVWCKSMLFFTHCFIYLQEEKISSFIYIYIYPKPVSLPVLQIRNPKPNSRRKNK